MRRPFGTRSKTIGLAAIAVAIAAVTISGVISAVGAGDNNIPGVPIPASPFSEALDDHTDFDDVYAVSLGFNDRLDVSMTGEAGSQFDMWLWSPSSSSIFVDAPMARVVQSSQDPASSTERFWFPVRSAGTYYLHVFNPLDAATSSKGAYTISYTITPLTAPDVTVQAPSAVGWNKSANITGSVTLNGAPMGGARVLLQSKAAGTSAWKDVNFDSARYRPKTAANGSGTFSYSVKPSKKTQYRAVVWPTENSGWRFGAASTVAPRVRLGAPHTPKSVRRKAKFTAYGYLAPRHAARAKTVTLVFSRGSRVVRAKAVNSNHSSKTWGKSSKYTARVSLPTKGRWKVVATTKSDSLHSATTSSVRYITVR